MTDWPKPTSREIKKYVRKWKTSPEMRKYQLQEKMLNILFADICKSNKCTESISLKVRTLNNFYSTHIINTNAVVKHIESIKDLNARLRRGDPQLVTDISRVKVSGKVKCFYSFASKYCNRYHPNKFPIYDSYVVKSLVAYRKKDHFYSFTQKSLKDYKKFYDVVCAFRSSYDLENFSLREIDNFLWQVGKEQKMQENKEKQRAQLKKR